MNESNRTGAWRLPGWMWLRVLLAVVVAMVALGLLARIALPFFISTANVKVSMERALSSWTGAEAKIDGDPEITFWPHPRLTLHSVRFEGGTHAAADQPASADAISAGFDVLGTLRGTPVFHDFRLIRPTFLVKRFKGGTLNWQRAGWMAQAVSGQAADGQPAPRSLPIGDVTIEDGTLVLSDEPNGSSQEIDRINGVIEWPTPADRIKADLTMSVNGETVSLTLACDEPLELLSGRNSPITLAVAASPASFSFDGIANGSAYPFASGRLKATAPSLPALIGRYTAKDTSLLKQGSGSLDATMTMAGDTLKLDNLSLSLGESSATGVLDISWSLPGRPHLGGTLAFDDLDLTPLIGPFLPALKKIDHRAFPQGNAPVRPQIDLRLSARQARYGSVALGNVAAGIMIENGRASLDIGDSTYEGGSLSAHAEVSALGSQIRGALRRADLAAVADAFGLEGPLPFGRGTLSIDLSSPNRLSETTASDLRGSFAYDATDGVLTHFNTQEFERLAGLGAFFNAAQIADGSFSFSSAELRASISNGTAELTKADITGEGRTLSLAGVISYGSASVALAGALRPEDPQRAPIEFFVGGAWPGAVVSPLAAIPAKE